MQSERKEGDLNAKNVEGEHPHLRIVGYVAFSLPEKGSKACHVFSAIQFVLQCLDILHQVLTVKLRIYAN